MKYNGGYGTYRGRSPFRTFLKWVIILLAAVLILAVAALVLLQPYVVYSDDGVAKLELPWLQLPEGTASPAPGQSTAEPTPTLAVLVTPTPTPPPPDAIHAVALPETALYDGTAVDQLKAAGANAAIFDMKQDSGLLGYVSALPLAIEAETSSGNPAINAAIQALNAQEGLYTVARVSCFKDDRLSNADKTLNILTNSGYLWTDPQKVKWTSPTSDAVRQYVTAVCRELAALGFDEILLDHAGYPTEGNISYIKKGANYDRAELSNIITAFYAQMETALADYPGVKLSIVTDETTIAEGNSALSGQTVSAMAQHADRVWTEAEKNTREELAGQLVSGGMENARDKLVVIASQPGPDTEHWVVWSPN